MRCAVLVFRDGTGDADRFRQSLSAAKAQGLGDFHTVTCIGHGASGPEDLRAVAQTTKEDGYDWILAVTDAETLVPDIFVKIAPALRLHDAVWGAALLSFPQPPALHDPTPSPSPQGGGEQAAVRGGAPAKPDRITRLPAQDLPSFFHATLAWWIGPSHFVRPGLALAALREPVTAGWYADYMMSLWRDARAYKTAQALTSFSGTLPTLAEADREGLVEALERAPVFMDVSHGSHRLRLPYTGVNPIIEREQMRGQFFEPEELRFLADRLPRGLRIVDAGANTGNHTVFFASVMAAEKVTPVEPHPRAVAAIRESVAANRLGNVDLSCLGIALGSSRGRVRPVMSPGGGLGATRYVPDPQGAIAVAPLDDLPAGPVDFLKIDVEGMEMEVLAGAAALIARDRPALYIEVLDASVGLFMGWADANHYRVEKLFPDKTHCNYLLFPDAT